MLKRELSKCLLICLSVTFVISAPQYNDFKDQIYPRKQVKQGPWNQDNTDNHRPPIQSQRTRRNENPPPSSQENDWHSYNPLDTQPMPDGLLSSDIPTPNQGTLQSNGIQSQDRLPSPERPSPDDRPTQELEGKDRYNLPPPPPQYPNNRPNDHRPPPYHGPPPSDHRHPPYQGPPASDYRPPPHHGPPHHGPPHHGPPHHGPPHHGPPHYGPPNHGPPHHGPPHHGPPHHVPPNHGPPYHGPPHHGPPPSNYRPPPHHGPPSGDHRPPPHHDPPPSDYGSPPHTINNIPHNEPPKNYESPSHNYSKPPQHGVPTLGGQENASLRPIQDQYQPDNGPPRHHISNGAAQNGWPDHNPTERDQSSPVTTPPIITDNDQIHNVLAMIFGPNANKVNTNIATPVNSNKGGVPLVGHSDTAYMHILGTHPLFPGLHQFIPIIPESG